MNVSKFEQSLRNNMESHVVGFDFSIILPLLVEILSGLLGDCLNKRGRGAVSEALADPTNIWTRVAVRRATSRAFAEQGSRGAYKAQRQVRESVLQTCSSCNSEEIAQLLDDVDENGDYVLI